MNAFQMREGKSAPNCVLPARVTFALSLGEPIHTAVDNWGVNPTNHTSALSWVVPVLPAAGCLESRAFRPVPEITF